MTDDKLLKKLKKFIKKEWDIPDMHIKANDTLISIAERIVIRSENCSLEDAYKKWIFKPEFHLPGWVCMYITEEFVKDTEGINPEMKIIEIMRYDDVKRDP